MNLQFHIFSQKDVIFLYPDLINGIQGQFTSKGLLIAGRRGKVLGEKYSNESPGLKEIQFVVDDLESPFLKSDVATKVHLR